MNLATSVDVARLEDKPGGAITGFNAEIRIDCTDCGQKFQFPGPEPGMDLQGALCSLDGLGARIAISPEGSRPNPIQRKAYGITGHLSWQSLKSASTPHTSHSAGFLFWSLRLDVQCTLGARHPERLAKPQPALYQGMVMQPTAATAIFGCQTAASMH